MLFRKHGQSLCWTGNKSSSPYPNVGLVSDKVVAVALSGCLALWLMLLFVGFSASVSIVKVVYTSYLTLSLLIWLFLLIHDGHLILNYSAGSLGLGSVPVLFLACCVLAACVCSSLSLATWLEQYSDILIVLQIALTVLANWMASILLIRFSTHGMSFIVTPSLGLGLLHMVFFGYDTAFCQGLDRWEDAYRVDGFMSHCLQGVCYTLASLFNAPIYIVFRHNKSRLLGSKSGLRFTGKGGNNIDDPELEPFFNGNTRRTPEHASSPNPDFHTRLLDRKLGRLVDATLDSEDEMLVNGKSNPFVALSHTWAEPGSRDEQAWLAALRRSLGSGTGRRRRYCWIDSLCVNQTSLPEVSAAVTSMGRLYRAANLVLVQDLRVPVTDAVLLLVARLTAGTALALLCTFTVGRCRQAEQGGAMPLWFTRIWTLQEGRLARELAGWSAAGIPVRVAQLMFADSCFTLDTGLTQPEDGGDLFDDLSASDVLSIAQKRHSTRVNDKMYGLFGLLPAKVVLGINVDYSLPFDELYRQVVCALFREGDHSLLAGSEGISGRLSPRWIPPFGTLRPLIGPCTQPGSSDVTSKGLKLTVTLVGAVKTASRIQPSEFKAIEFAELICEAYVGMSGLQFVGGVWQARQYYEEDYDDGELEDLRQLVEESALQRGGLVKVYIELHSSQEVQRRIGWADGPINEGDIVAARCLDGDGGSLVILRSEGSGYIQAGGVYGGTHMPLEELPRRSALFVA